VTRSGSGATMTWQLTFSGLTGPANAAHIHIAPRGQPGGVAVPLCGPCQSLRAGPRRSTRTCCRRSSPAVRT
jgi:hypothetical protein